jgi:acetate kinase
VFTGGIGENAAPIRVRIMRGAEWLGLELDPAANAAHRTCITTPDSDIPAYVIPTNEELMIARDTRAVVGA